MSDILETNLPAEENAGKLEEANVPEVTPEITVSDMETEDSTDTVASGAVGKLSKEEILSKLSDLVEVSVEESRSEIESLKQAYYKIRRNEVEELKKTFLENGGDEKDFSAPVDEIETQIKNLLNVYKEKRAALVAEEERVKEANYALKLQLIEQLKQLTESQEDFNKLYNDFKDIQNRWKEVKAVPQEFANELWKNYQIYSEKFYDIIKINNQFRDYDFKKNLELKTALCETVEKLEEEPDIISAFHQLQKLHQQWKEIGPVSKELREELWTRFKNASTAINKKHQAHFEGLKSREQENLDAKTAICEEIEAIDMDALKTFKDWEEMNKQVIALQEKWKTIGFAPKKANVKIFERFRAACDAYFNRKNDFYKAIKNDMERNLELKKALCEKAEALKDSTDWKDSTDKLIALQKEWKTIGSVARKHSDTIWKRFISACDYFFEQKNKNVSSQKSVERDNLAAKKQLIEKVNSLDESLKADQAVSVLKGLIAEWNTIGHVPFKEKDKVYKEFHDAVDKQFDRLKVGQAERKMQSFRSSITDMNSGEKGKNKLYGERERLMRYYERLKTEVQTYENNIGFLSVSSKGGSGLVKEMERKIENLKEEMALTVKKIDAIDENLE
jgi:chromosome segregation ATPase